MKRISSSILALCLACGIAAPASASSFSINGYTMMMGQMSNNLDNFAANADNWKHFDVNQRIAVEFEWIASERLNARLDARVPQNGTWGDNFDFNTGNYFNLYEAYFNWLIPIVDVDVTVGQQSFTLPGYMGTASNPVYDDNQVGFAFKKAFGNTLGVNFNFIRMENAQARTFGAGEGTGYSKVAAVKDVYTLELPVTTNVLDVTPWGAVALIEEGRQINSEYSLTVTNTDSDKVALGVNGIAPVGSELKNQLAYFGGLTSKVKLIPGLNFGVDVLVSGSTMEDGAKSSSEGVSTKTFEGVASSSSDFDSFVALYKDDANFKIEITAYDKTTGKPDAYKVTYTGTPAAEYNVKYGMGLLADGFVTYDLPFMTIGLNGWYATGDKIDTKNDTVEYNSILSLNGSWGNEKSAYFANGGLLYNTGVSTPSGTMGGGLTLTAAPMQKLNVGFNVMYVMGTHEYINDDGDNESQGNVNFLTAKDSLIDLGAAVSYDIYDNFQVNAGGNYVMPTYDGKDTDNGFVLGLGVNYIF